MAEEGDTRERILRAALGLMSERGYLGATTRDISRRAGVSEPTLFRKFGTKESLFGELLASHSFLPLLRDLLGSAAGLPLHEGLVLIGTRYIENLQEKREFVRILVSELTTYPGKVRAAHADMVRGMESSLGEFLALKMEAGLLRDADPHEISRIFLRLLFSGFLVEEVVRDRRLSGAATRGMVEGCVDIFLNGAASGRPPAPRHRTRRRQGGSK